MNSFRRLLVLAAVSLAGSTLHAETLLLKNGIIVTVSGQTWTNGAVAIRDGRIQAVGSSVPEQADKVIDLKGAKVFPGLIAPTTVLGLLEIDALRATRDTTEVGDFTPDVSAWIAVNPDSELIPVARANGFTHAQAIPTGGVVSGVSGVIQLDGWTIEDLAMKKAAALHVRWPAFALNTTPKELAANKDSWKSIEDQVRDRDRKLREIDTFFDEATAYSEAKKAAGSGAFRIVPSWEAMLPFVRNELPLWIHADEARQIRAAANWIARRKYRAVIAGGLDAWREAALLATNGIAVAYEHVFTQPVRDTDGYDTQFSAPAVLAKAGVTVAFSEGTDRFGASNIRNVPYAAAQARAFGLPYEEAIRGLTLYPARILGVADRIGSIEPGKDATLIAVDGDILDLRVNVKRMWIRGKEVGLESRHTRLYEKYRNRPVAK